jgi:hypothetical protein
MKVEAFGLLVGKGEQLDINPNEQELGFWKKCSSLHLG